jgi:hypothetical protein
LRLNSAKIESFLADWLPKQFLQLGRSMTITISLKPEHFNSLDVSPVQTVIEKLIRDGAIAASEQKITFEINYPREPEDPRELPEIPEIRLWFVRLDAAYPWLPFLLDWKSGELARYTAMLVPHQFHRVEGIQYNPEALELFVMKKVFVLADWLKQYGIPSKARVKSMAQMFGYELDDEFFNLVAV